MSTVLDRDALEKSPLADLHLIANELGVDGFRRLRKADLIDAIIVTQSGDGAPAAEEAAGAPSPDCVTMMASIRSALRRRRKPSRPSSVAIVCRSASGLSSSAERESTDMRVSFGFCRWAPAPRCVSAAGDFNRGR